MVTESRYPNMSNRVEQLEQTVSELQSTVEGLTEELVDTKERLRAIEHEFDVTAADFVEGEATLPPKEADPTEIEQAVDGHAAEADKADAHQETDESDDAEDADDTGTELGDDIIVA